MFIICYKQRDTLTFTRKPYDTSLLKAPKNKSTMTRVRLQRNHVCVLIRRYLSKMCGTLLVVKHVKNSSNLTPRKLAPIWQFVFVLLFLRKLL